MTFDEKRKRAKLVVISATKLTIDHQVDDGSDDDDDDDKGGADDDVNVDVDAPLGDTVQREKNGRGRILCTRL